MRKNKMEERLGEERLNNQGCLMKIIKYNEFNDIVIQFQDNYKAEIRTRYDHFLDGSIKNPYHISVCNKGIVGSKYPSSKSKEYKAWNNILNRCFNDKIKQKYPVYKDVTCCDEWLLFENFYDWVHSQENFEQWLNGKRWDVDKDIIIKNNKVYSPETCCLVPNSINKLFTKNNATRGNLPIGVIKSQKWGFTAQCMNPFTGKCDYLGYDKTMDGAFKLYKLRKENIIKQVAQIEYNKGNITRKCYEAMMKYKVEIDD